MANHIVPAIIPTSFDHLDESLRIVEPFTTEVQVDIVDGAFVPFRSWPYVGSGSIQLLSRYTDTFQIEVDLMIMSPEDAVPLYVAAGVTGVVVHLESTRRIETILAHHDEHTYALGLSINNDTPIGALMTLIPRVDYVQLMGIAHIGSQGQPFDVRVLDRVREIRSMYPDIIISIDGSVNKDTLPRLIDAGATRFVSGSAIFHVDDPEAAYRTLESM